MVETMAISAARKLWTAHPWREGLALTSSGSPPVFSCAAVSGDGPLMGQPPLPFGLGVEDIERIEQAGAFGAAAASCFGPSTQDKLCNEDAAIAAAFTPPLRSGGSATAMICVADGVSTRTFWSERASRIACLAAYVTVRDHLAAGRGSTMEDIESMRAGLCAALAVAFKADRERLLMDKAIPTAWNPATFAKHRENLGLWYNTTLIVAVMSLEGGFALWAGDGALVRSRRLKGGTQEIVQPLKSGPTNVVFNVASLGGPIKMNAARIDAPSGLADLRLALMTDGAEKTSELNGEGVSRWLRRDVCGRDTGASLADTLARVASHDGAERDNHSVATLDWSVLAAATRPAVPRTLAPRATLVPAPKTPRGAGAAGWRPVEWKPASVPSVRRKPAPLTDAQRQDLAILARSKFITTQWLAMFVSVRCDGDRPESEALAAFILSVAPRRKALPREIEEAINKPAETREDMETLVRDIERLAMLYNAVTKLT